MLHEGGPAPEFSLRSDTSELITLPSLRGRPVVLYFYPEDDSLPPRQYVRMTGTTIPEVGP